MFLWWILCSAYVRAHFIWNCWRCIVPLSLSPPSLSTDLSLISSVLDADKPCYIVFRLPENTGGWCLFCYVPDKSKVKEKMVYASSRSNLKQQLGANYFQDEVFGTVPVSVCRSFTVVCVRVCVRALVRVQWCGVVCVVVKYICRSALIILSFSLLSTSSSWHHQSFRMIFRCLGIVTMLNRNVLKHL